MLTSMLKRLDLTIFEQAEKTAAGTFESGIHILGLAEGMVGFASEDGMVTAAMESAVAAASAEIVSGSMEVADWSQE
jgi:basic membrane protein A